MRENPSTGLTGEFRKRRINKNNYGYISPMCPEAPHPPWTDVYLIWHSCMGRRRDKIFGDHLRGVDSVGGGGENCPFPLTKPVAVNTGLALLGSL